MNSNNWLSFPLSPTHTSLPPHLQTTQPHHFSLGLVTESIDNPFQNQEWNSINTQGGNEVPKVADFLGVSKSGHESELVSSYNGIQANDPNYFYPNTNLMPVQNSLAATQTSNYDLQENACNVQSLTLSMGSGKSSTSETSASPSANATARASSTGENSNTTSIVEAAPRRTSDTFGQRTSIYRGVTRHRWTGRYEAHLWDNSCRREGQSRKGRQVYLGGYDKEDKAARSYDLAALKYWGASTTTNFPISNYEKELEDMKHMTRQEFIAAIRRKSTGFSRGASMYRGVTRHHQHGRWQARIGRVAGNKDLYLGTFGTEEEAAEAYDVAAIKFRGLCAVTNFDMNRYDVKSILESNTLPVGGGAAKRLKEAQAIESARKLRDQEMLALNSSTFQYGTSNNSVTPFQTYPLMQQPFEAQPLLTLQNHETNSQYQESPHFQQSYIPTQLQLHQYNNYLQNNPAFLHGLMNMGSSSSVMDNNGGSSSGSYSTVGYLGNSTGLGMTSNSPSAEGGGSAEELGAVVKVDYDMPSGSYNGWSEESVQGSNPGVFTMWND